MTFKQFISTRRGTDNPRGDFIKDVKRDAGFLDCKAYEPNHDYLISQHACDEAMAEFEKLYRQYERNYKRR